MVCALYTLQHAADFSNRNLTVALNWRSLISLESIVTMKQLLFLLAATATLSVMAQGFGQLRYDYVSANLALPELDEIGFELEGSTEVTDNLVVFGTYRDFSPSNRIDRKTLQIGVGHYWDIRPNIDVMASLSYGDNEISRRGRNFNDDGLILGGHIRGWLTQKIELNGAVLLDNSFGSSTETVLELGGQYFHEINWSYGGRVRVDETDSVLFLGARFYFGASRR